MVIKTNRRRCPRNCPGDVSSDPLQGEETRSVFAFRRRHEKSVLVELWAAKLFLAADNQTKVSEHRRSR
jgi:hypothetical protein